MKRLYLFRNEGKWALQHLQLGNDGEGAWDRFVAELYKTYSRVFDEELVLEIVSHRLEDIERGIMEKVGGSPTISMDPCITGDIDLGVSRLFSPGGNVELGIHERPGFPPLEEQIRRIPAGEYFLIEDDIFSGGTIQEFIRLMCSVNDEIIIKKLIVGIQVGEQKLSVPVEALYNYDSEEVIDLNDPRDFLAGAYGGGLVIRYPSAFSQNQPVDCRMPYILPFVDTAARSSVPRKRVLEFSKMIWELNLEFWRGFPEVRIMDVEKYFGLMALRWGVKQETVMHSFCEYVLNLLAIPSMGFGCSGKGVIWIDLNGTLITENSGMLTVDGNELRAAVTEVKERGWQVGLCSDSPAGPLISWGSKHSIDGPVIAENGAVLRFYSEVNPVLQELFPRKGVDSQAIKQIVKDWARAHSMSLLEDVLSPEFQEPSGVLSEIRTGIAFGAERIASVSVFCIKEGAPDGEVIALLASYLKEHVREDVIDFSEDHGFIAIHSTISSSGKGQTLRWIGWELYKEGRECWMIGNSRSDLTYAPALCRVGLVECLGDVPAEQLAVKPCTQGIIEMMRSIVGI